MLTGKERQKTETINQANQTPDNIKHPALLDSSIREEIAGEWKPHQHHADDKMNRHFKPGHVSHEGKWIEGVRALTDQRERHEQRQPIIRLVPGDDQTRNPKRNRQEKHQCHLRGGDKRWYLIPTAVGAEKESGLIV